ncbi:MAG: hypothetical protein IKZ98_14200 [Clostridia bacterium]|nr:hypothetical protein [Clostridia bacterium]
MNRKTINTWMNIISLVLGVAGIVLILVSVFDENAGNAVLILGLLAVALGTVLNIFRMRQDRKGGNQ